MTSVRLDYTFLLYVFISFCISSFLVTAVLIYYLSPISDAPRKDWRMLDEPDQARQLWSRDPIVMHRLAVARTRSSQHGTVDAVTLSQVNFNHSCFGFVWSKFHIQSIRHFKVVISNIKVPTMAPMLAEIDRLEVEFVQCHLNLSTPYLVSLTAVGGDVTGATESATGVMWTTQKVPPPPDLATIVSVTQTTITVTLPSVTLTQGPLTGLEIRIKRAETSESLAERKPLGFFWSRLFKRHKRNTGNLQPAGVRPRKEHATDSVLQSGHGPDLLQATSHDVKLTAHPGQASLLHWQVARDHGPSDQGVPTRVVPDRDVPDKDVPGGDVPARDVPDRDVPDRDVPDRDVPDRDVPDKVTVESKREKSRRVQTDNQLHRRETTHPNQVGLNTTNEKLLGERENGMANTRVDLQQMLAGTEETVLRWWFSGRQATRPGQLEGNNGRPYQVVTHFTFAGDNDNTSQHKRDAKVEDNTSQQGREAKVEDNTSQQGRKAKVEDNTSQHKRDTKVEDNTSQHKRDAKVEDNTSQQGREAKVEDNTSQHKRDTKVEDNTSQQGREAKVEDNTSQQGREAKVEDNTSQHKRDTKVEDNTSQHLREAKVEDNTSQHGREAKVWLETDSDVHDISGRADTTSLFQPAPRETDMGVLLQLAKDVEELLLPVRFSKNYTIGVLHVSTPAYDTGSFSTEYRHILKDAPPSQPPSRSSRWNLPDIASKIKLFVREFLDATSRHIIFRSLSQGTMDVSRSLSRGTMDVSRSLSQGTMDVSRSLSQGTKDLSRSTSQGTKEVSRRKRSILGFGRARRRPWSDGAVNEMGDSLEVDPYRTWKIRTSATGQPIRVKTGYGYFITDHYGVRHPYFNNSLLERALRRHAHYQEARDFVLYGKSLLNLTQFNDLDLHLLFTRLTRIMEVNRARRSKLFLDMFEDFLFSKQDRDSSQQLGGDSIPQEAQLGLPPGQPVARVIKQSVSQTITIGDDSQHHDLPNPPLQPGTEYEVVIVVLSTVVDVTKHSWISVNISTLAQQPGSVSVPVLFLLAVVIFAGLLIALTHGIFQCCSKCMSLVPRGGSWEHLKSVALSDCTEQRCFSNITKSTEI